ncbi:hypothetical protein B5M42_012000 [Paenibacillus athensensis]|uniref:receptor protein-tyrosine kinase n=1 Tax=Paenibacillus athensensis TaxID=1967502 RepID=A0A4Y8Q5C0_9BACL|nr:glycine-rich protein [Paenibacillus athensensis]MCD1259553.1 hypothetical protein [Paenibacillus athensensis]
MKQLFRIVLAFILLVMGIPIYIPIQHADAFTSTISDKAYETGSWFSDGKYVFVTWDKKATTGIKYRTAGFIMRQDPTCEGNQCTPLKGTPNDYMFIEKGSNGIEALDSVNECLYIQNNNHKYNSKSLPDIAKETRCTLPGDPDEVLVSKYEAKKSTITTLMSGNPTFKNYKDGDIVYLSAIYEVYGSTANNGKKYYQHLDSADGKKGIYDAETWGCKNSGRAPCNFLSRYDMPIVFKGSYPIYVQTLREDTRTGIGSPATREIINTKPDPDYENGKWPAGKYDKANTQGGTGIVLDPEIVSGGKTFILKCSYITRVTDPVAKDCSSETEGPEWVKFDNFPIRNPQVYIGGTYVIALYTPVDKIECHCKQAATVPNKSDYEGEVPVDNTKIGKKVPVQVDLQQSDPEVNNWKKWVKGKSNFQMRIRLWRTDTGLNNTGQPAIWEAVGKAPSPQGGDSPEVWNDLTDSGQLIDMLDGGSPSKALYNDNLMGYPIPEGGKVSFRYNASVWIRAKDSTGNWVTVQCSSDTASTELKWFRPKKPKKDVGSFFSIPKYFSEIKEGSPQPFGTSSNETFDAMSGMPTTRNLYFASGGSEFIVDIQVEYVPKVTQTRTYKSEFFSVKDGWALPVIDGPQSKTAPPKPAARKVTDACGATYTENVSSTSGQYAIGTDKNGNTIYETRYGWKQEGHSDGPVGGYSDSWTQTVTFDYMKINKVAVWKLEKSKVNGMQRLVGTDEITASITQGDPTYFMNVAGADTSAAGRLRYSVEPDQHDAVYWKEGDSDNCHTNSDVSGTVKEKEIFKQRRETTGNVTAVSDFLILQTSSGDQSVMYFEKPSNTAKTTDQLDVPVSDFNTMWTNNPLSAAKWDQRETIKVGSYNGQYSSPAIKYSGAGGGTVSTIFDSKPAGLNRTPRPSLAFRLQETGKDIPDNLKNGQYQTGVSSVFYKLMFTPVNKNGDPFPYSTAVDPEYQQVGQSFTSTYSPLHNKVNDIVIHDPVSVENAMVISLPGQLDQRTPETKFIGGNRQEGVAEYERVLDPAYRQNIIPNPDAEIVNEDTTVAGWNTWVQSGTSSNMIFTSRTKDMWVISGVYSFEVTSLASSGTTGGYWKDIPVKPNTHYKFEADMSCHRCAGYFSLDLYSSGYGWQGGGFGSSDVNTSNSVQHKTISFTTTADTAYVRIHMIKGSNTDATSYARDYLFVDNMTLKNMDVQEFVAVAPVYVTKAVNNPDYVAPTSGSTDTYNYTGTVQTFKAAFSGTFTIEVWGAEGGTGCQKGCSGGGGRGGYAKGNITLNAGDVLNIYVGGQGGSSGAAGWNGGGSANSSNGGGGGASDVRKGGNALSDRIIVAGGGGGGGSGTWGGAGGGSSGGDGGGTSEVDGGTGGTQLTGYSLGSGGSVSGDASAGGGGYYGGQGAQSHGCSNPNASGGGGSGYVGGVTSPSWSTGVNSGNGKVVITSPPTPAVGSPTIIVSSLAGGSDTNPPSEAYKLETKTQNPMTPSGGYTPGNFVLLDYGFQVYFPNTGDFYGNGQWGWGQTTATRGKGFVGLPPQGNGDEMDVTEWTKEKYVKFGFHVIYNGTLYKAGDWIQLPLNSPTGDWKYDFYVPLANREKISALVEFKSIAINASFEDNELPTNKTRYENYAAKHSTVKKFNIDVVGRIGNMVIEDTGDYRFSNFFKQPVDPTQWLIPNVVKKVDPNQQNLIIGDKTDIRGNPVSSVTQWLNTWGLLTHMQQNPVAFPLLPENNNISALKNQPLRIGYKVFTDIQTMGNYYSDLQVIPYYYHLNLTTKEITKVDMYMDVNGTYKLINKFGGTSSSVYFNPVRMNWEEEVGRRNVKEAELEQTDQIANLFAQSGGDSATGKAAQPFGNYQYGSSQIMNLTGRNRTYVGQDQTYGWNKNPGSKLSLMEYGMQAQRWHFQFELPSSAVAIPKDQPIKQANIDQLRTNTSVILMAADITAFGDTYSLKYKASGENDRVTIAGVSCDISSIPYPVVAVFSANKSSANDLSVSGTH